MSDPRYDSVGRIGDRLSEECAELIMAICKAARFGLDKYHPEHPEWGNNAEQIKREIGDVRARCDEMEIALRGFVMLRRRDDA